MQSAIQDFLFYIVHHWSILYSQYYCLLQKLDYMQHYLPHSITFSLLWHTSILYYLLNLPSPFLIDSYCHDKLLVLMMHISYWLLHRLWCDVIYVLISLSIYHSYIVLECSLMNLASLCKWGSIYWIVVIIHLYGPYSDP